MRGSCLPASCNRSRNRSSSRRTEARAKETRAKETRAQEARAQETRAQEARAQEARAARSPSLSHPKPTPKPTPTPKAEPKPEPKPTPKPDASSRADALAAIARDELSTVVNRTRQATEATATASEMSASFVALIQQTVVNYWSRPPSARNGMEVELAIQLIPTGEVVSVTVIRSSGNTAFDRSAVNAVQKAGAFPELQKLPNGEFEKTFRRFRLLFKPEDLRY